MKRISILLVMMLFMVSACEDFLTKTPADQVATELAIQTIEDAKVALNGVYSGFKSTSYYGRNFVAYADVQTDVVQSVIGYSNQLGEIYKWSYLSDNGGITNAWDVMYTVIVRASNVIDALPELEATPAELNQIEGEARLARAIAHFDLVKAFAKAYTQSDPASELGVPIIEHFEIAEPERNTLQEVYNFILDEAATAAALMADNGADDVASVYLTPVAAEAFMARVNLYMGNWSDAVGHATTVIDNANYGLATDSASYASMFLNDVGPEVIFRVGLTKADYNGRYIGYNYYNSSQGAPNSDYIPAQWILDLFSGNDIRSDIVFRFNTTKFGWAWNLVWKYPGNPLFYDNPEVTTNSNMYKMFRISEMYLIRAEANAELTNDVLALQDYNDLRSNRIEGYVEESHTGEGLKTAIWVERNRELCFEGHRMWDLKRKGLGFTRVPIDHPINGTITNPGPSQNELSVTASDPRWQWPIPDEELKANENITPNPGY
jgi:hypothetical protein